MKEDIINYLKNKEITIPEKDDEILNYYFGLLLVEKINYWINRGYNFIEEEKPETPFEREWSDVAKQDKEYRNCFNKLTERKKIIIKKLLKESIEGIIFSTLLLFDEMDNCKIELTKENITTILNKNVDLHEEYYKWLNIFNEKENK